jgi:hypothetical protein
LHRFAGFAITFSLNLFLKRKASPKERIRFANSLGDDIEGGKSNSLPLNLFLKRKASPKERIRFANSLSDDIESEKVQ